MSADAGLGLVRELDAESIEPLLRDAKGMVIMEFYSPNCPVCQMISPIIAGMAKEMTGKVVFSRLNTDAYPEISTRLGVLATPTFIFFCGGRPVGAWVGFASEAAMRNTIEDLNRHKEACIRTSTPLPSRILDAYG
ncbi:MAG: thioredoxin family protein [Methanomassiliicoccales archaeon]|nr:thioredoxin family protein [Methanomassiliicoccales archaeon]